MMSVLAVARGVGRNVLWYVKSMMGDDAYEKYRAHHGGVHGQGDAPARAPMTEREFWRDHTDRQDANPQGRCC